MEVKVISKHIRILSKIFSESKGIKTFYIKEAYIKVYAIV